MFLHAVSCIMYIYSMMLIHQIKQIQMNEWIVHDYVCVRACMRRKWYRLV